MSPSHLLASLLLGVPLADAALPTPPVPVDKRLQVELVAMEPEIRTPTAIATDARGRVWVLENNTHFRPKIYDAPATDRVVILDDFGPDGRARKFTTFMENFRDGMGLLLHGDDVIIATRDEVIKARDTDGDGRADEGVTLLKLVTEDKYPHNGLSGLAVGPDENGKPVLFVGFGENHGIPWKLTGADGRELQGTDEGAIFRVGLDGGNVLWWALGMWNPYGVAFGKDGQLFALENDPGGGSLCRLLHIVPGGDYGYRYRYGRTIDHPFLSWLGQIPGTLPPVCLVGEAPTGLTQVKGKALPSELHGELLGCTWTEHGVQRYPLTAKGVSYTSKPEWVVRGGQAFRPSGIAEAPDGSLVISDWADGSYDVHGKGRVWRVKARPETGEVKPERKTATGEAPGTVAPTGVARAASAKAQVTDLSSEDPFVFRAAVQGLVGQDMAALKELAAAGDPKHRLGALLALRLKGDPAARELLSVWLTDSDGAVRHAALKWIAEENLREHAPTLEKVLGGNPSRGTFLAYLAAEQMLLGKEAKKDEVDAKIVRVALDEARSPELRALALRLAPVDYKTLDTATLQKLIALKHAGIRLQAVRILAARRDAPSQTALRELATEQSLDSAFRAEALAGLAGSREQPETKTVLTTLAAGSEPVLAQEAKRTLGIPETAPVAALASQEPDTAAGRRLFYHPDGPRCATCHAIEGRGGVVGPDLTQMGRFTEAQLLEAIREPSKEVAPAYTQWHLKLKDGREVLGIDLFEDNKSQLTLMDATGKKEKYKFDDLTSREPLDISLMPPALDATLTPQELRNLIAYLRESRD